MFFKTTLYSFSGFCKILYVEEGYVYSDLSSWACSFMINIHSVCGGDHLIYILRPTNQIQVEASQ